MNNIKKISLLPVYFIGFLFAFHTAIPTYINSSFLNTFISEEKLGIVYSVASALTILCFFFMPFILQRLGNYRASLILILLDLAVLLGLSFFRGPFLLISFFVINLISISLVYFLLDIFLEGGSQNVKTGRVRGIYLTAVNLAWAISPLVSGLILTSNSYWKIYFASFALLLPTLFILIANLKKFKDSEYQATHLAQTFKIVFKNKNIRSIFFAYFLLYFFYSWMTIYTPIYLYKYIGFSWGQIGTIFFVMLLPFIFIQFPLGRLADKRTGEKEILTLGFIIIALSTGLISFFNSANLISWAVILFITRIGAGMIEIMCDTYFFKNVDGLNANIISFYRMSGPLACVTAPLCATILFSVFSFDIKYLFLVLALVMITGVKFSLAIKDTK